MTEKPEAEKHDAPHTIIAVGYGSLSAQAGRGPSTKE